MTLAASHQALERLRAILGAWPETREKLSHGAPTWWGGRKTFATFADDHHGDGRVAVWVKSSFLDQEMRIETDPGTYFVPPYVGPRGWVGMRLDRDPDWGEVEDLLEAGYRLVAPQRAIAELDAETGFRERAANGSPDRGPRLLDKTADTGTDR